MKKKADIILYNATIYTADSLFSVKSAMAIRDKRISALGTDEEILRRFDAPEILDLDGNAVYPGFIDGHCHFFSYGLGITQYVDLRGTKSFDEVLQLLRNYHERYPYIWIVGRGWDQNDWENKEFPDNGMLDRLFPDNPVVLSRVDGHAVVANSEALRRAGITAARKIDGGEILLENGVMTGILVDNAADTMKEAIPDPDARLVEEALLKGQENCFAAGLTGVVDAGLDLWKIMAIDSLQKAGKLKLHVNVMISPTEENFRHFMKNGPYQTDRLHINSVKLYADGALGSRGALLLEPYTDDPGNYGLVMANWDFYRKWMLRAYLYGYQANTHCIGDLANRMILRLYGDILGGPNDRRWRIEHAQIVEPTDLPLFKKYNVIPSVQTTHCTSDMYWAGDRLGEERLKNAYAYKDLLEQNGWLVNGTDFPVEEINPLYTFYAAVARQDLEGYPEGGFQPENALTREEALRSITIWPAKGSFEEDRRGSLEAGKDADFVILDKDIMTCDLHEIPGIKVLKTYLDGERVY